MTSANEYIGRKKINIDCTNQFELKDLINSLVYSKQPNLSFCIFTLAHQLIKKLQTKSFLDRSSRHYN